MASRQLGPVLLAVAAAAAALGAVAPARAADDPLGPVIRAAGRQATDPTTDPTGDATTGPTFGPATLPAPDLGAPVAATAPAAEPTSRAQAPLPAEQPADVTPSQGQTNQFNQLFMFETTPSLCAAGEGYVSGQFDYLKFPGSVRQYRYQLQGQYGITDQWSVGAYLPILHTDYAGQHNGVGDVGLYGQYKFDRLVNPEVVDLTAQLDVILPTGSVGELRDTGRFGVRPLALVYKDFGRQGPGTLGAYGLLGFTITTHSDFRVGLAASYEVNRLAGVLEFFDTTGNRLGRPLVSVTPGLVYRGIDRFEFAAGVPLGVNNGSPHWGAIFKATYAFPN